VNAESFGTDDAPLGSATYVLSRETDRWLVVGLSEK
jgi:hypothetical protein